MCFRHAWARISQGEPLPLPLEDVEFGQTRPSYRPGEAGESPDADLIQATLATWYDDADKQEARQALNQRVAITL